MHTIVSFGLVTDKFAMGSSEPLSTPPAAPSVEDADTQESDTAILDGPLEKAANMSEKMNVGKRKRGTFTDGELATFSNMTVVVKDGVHAIGDNKPTHMHLDL
jgi:hypothetical protein